MITLHKTITMNDHIVHASGKMKTVCVTACLTTIGVPFNSFQITGSIITGHYLKILNKFGFSARSRKSRMPKSLSIGACRKAIKKIGEDVVYFAVVKGSSYCHAILIDNEGNTIVDTSPRQKDKRIIHSIHAITKIV